MFFLSILWNPLPFFVDFHNRSECLQFFRLCWPCLPYCSRTLFDSFLQPTSMVLLEYRYPCHNHFVFHLCFLLFLFELRNCGCWRLHFYLIILYLQIITCNDSFHYTSRRFDTDVLFLLWPRPAVSSVLSRTTMSDPGKVQNALLFRPFHPSASFVAYQTRRPTPYAPCVVYESQLAFLWISSFVRPLADCVIPFVVSSSPRRQQSLISLTASIKFLEVPAFFIQPIIFLL